MLMLELVSTAINISANPANMSNFNLKNRTSAVKENVEHLRASVWQISLCQNTTFIHTIIHLQLILS